MAFLMKFLALCLVPLVTCQTLNGWDQTVFSNADSAVDGNTSTYWEGTVPAEIFLLFNSPQIWQGLYIQSSDAALLTDYTVQAYNDTNPSLQVVGTVANATSNFTVVTFTDKAGDGYMFTDEMYVYITGGGNGANGSVIIEEIYPIYALDTVYYPPGETAPTTTRNWATSTTTWSSLGESTTCTIVSSMTDTVPYPFPTSSTKITTEGGPTNYATSATTLAIYVTSSPIPHTVISTKTTTFSTYTPSTVTVNLASVATETATLCSYTEGVTATSYTGSFTPATTPVTQLLPAYDDCTSYIAYTTGVFVAIYTTTKTWTITLSTLTLTSTASITTTLADPSNIVSTTTISEATATTTTTTPLYEECYPTVATTTMNLACNPTNIMNDLEVLYPSQTGAGAGAPYATQTSIPSISSAPQCCQTCIDTPSCAAMLYEDWGYCYLYMASSNATTGSNGTCGYAYDVTVNPTTLNPNVAVSLGCGMLWDDGTGATLL